MIFQLQTVNARPEEQYEVGYSESHSVFTSKKETKETNSEFMWVAHRFKWKILKELLGKFQGDLVFIGGHAFCKIMPEHVWNSSQRKPVAWGTHKAKGLDFTVSLNTQAWKQQQSFRIKDEDRHNVGGMDRDKQRNDKNDQSCLRLNNQDTLYAVVGVWDGSWKNREF